MFGLGMGEIALIAIVALLVVGPDKLPDAVKSIGKGIRGLRKQTRELTDSIEKDTQLGDAMREIRSAMYDDPSYQPIKPRAAEPADAAADDAAQSPLADISGDDVVGDVANNGHDPELMHDAEHEPEHDTSMPQIRPAQGAVARGSDLGEDDSDLGEGDSDLGEGDKTTPETP